MSALNKDRGKEPPKKPGDSSWSNIMDKEDTDVNKSGGLGKKTYQTSWAQLLGSSLPSNWDKNVLEVILQKDDRGAFNVSDEDCARLMKKLGLDQRPGIHVETVQICPNGRGVILITLRKDVQIERFCRYDVMEVTTSGIRAILAKPAGKRESIVTMKGIHPNTTDDCVTDYLSKFGRLVSTKVIHGMFNEGPLKGFKNGDRSFKVEFKPNENMGTYHVIDGQRITARYPGQQQTCARCHETPQHCPGKGMAKKCEAADGPKVELTDYIMKLWTKIGYTPKGNQLSDDINEDMEAAALQQQEGGRFTPVKVASDPQLFARVCVKTFPKEADHGVIMEFLVKSGLNESHKDDVTIKPNGSVSIMNLTSSECTALISIIHHNIQFGRRLFCNGIIPLTPEKPGAPSTTPPPSTTAQATSSPGGDSLSGLGHF